jgi:hypothetical protein
MIKNLSMILASTVACAAFCTSCNDSEVPDERLVSAYVDVMIVRQSSLDTTVIAQRVDSVLQHHGFTSTEFFDRVREEGQRPRMFKAMFDSVAARYERMRDTTSR